MSVKYTDRLTVVFTYKTTFFRAFDLGFRDFYVLPRHQLAAAPAGYRRYGKANEPR